MSRADEFRKNADECRPAGARSRDPLDKEHWPKIVQDGRGGRSATGRRPMTSDCERTERLQVMLTTEEPRQSTSLVGSSTDPLPAPLPFAN